MDAAREARNLPAGWWWVARFVASLFLLLGALVFTTFLETRSVVYLAISMLGFGGALVFAFGIERPQHPLARRARQAGWAMMVAFSLVPTSLLFLPLLAALLALPAVVRTPRSRTAGSPLGG